VCVFKVLTIFALKYVALSANYEIQSPLPFLCGASSHIIIIIIFYFQNKQLQATVIAIRQPENCMINRAGCLWLQPKYGINYTIKKLNVRSKLQESIQCGNSSLIQMHITKLTGKVI